MSSGHGLFDGVRGVERSFRAGAHVFRRGRNVAVMHQVIEGAIHLVRSLPNGSTVVLQRAQAGAVLAEASLFSARYHCDAISVVPSRTRIFATGTLRSAFSADPALLLTWTAHLAREVQSTRQRAEILALRTVAERIDAWIAANGGNLPARGNWKVLAAEIGTSPEALYRELAARRPTNGPRSRT